MYKVPSSPNLTGLSGVSPPPIRKSFSSDDITENEFFFYEETFEGDGSLGMIWIVRDDKLVLKRIIPGTVAYEYYDLYTGMSVIEVNGVPVTKSSLKLIPQHIERYWMKHSTIKLLFQKPIYPEICKLLNQNDLLQYYDKFVELGAKTLEDIDYIEINDLKKMSMNSTEIQLLQSKFPSIL
jgi:hypothetical protein